MGKAHAGHEQLDMSADRRLGRVLVADDTATVRLLLRRTLEMSGLFVVVGEATDGGQAVELARGLRPDIVLLDLSMPVLDGMEAIPLIRRDAPEARIVVLSAFGPDGKSQRALAAGATAFLEKSQRPGQLVAALGEIWESARPDPAAEVTPDADVDRRAWLDAPVAMALVDPDDRIVRTNPAWHRLTGRAVHGPGTTLADLLHPEDRRAVATSAVAVEARIIRPGGRAVWVSIASSAGEGTRVVTMVDVSDQRRAADELARSNADLSSFAYLAAHELKAPLQAVSGFAALLDKVHAANLDDHGREFVRWIVDGSARMNSLIEDLLAYCAVDATEAVEGPVHLEQTLHDALDQLKAEVAVRGAVIESGPLPVVTGDPVQLVQLLENLLANALKFVEEGRAPRIAVSAERSEGAWVVTVADNGIGVADDARERIFGMFERLHPRERYGGTGIGLSICKRIIERRGGTVWVEANPGGGSRFRFSVPDVVPPAGALPA